MTRLKDKVVIITGGTSASAGPQRAALRTRRQGSHHRAALRAPQAGYRRSPHIAGVTADVSIPAERPDHHRTLNTWAGGHPGEQCRRSRNLSLADAKADRSPASSRSSAGPICFRGGAPISRRRKEDRQHLSTSEQAGQASHYAASKAALDHYALLALELRRRCASTLPPPTETALQDDGSLQQAHSKQRGDPLRRAPSARSCLADPA